MERIWHHNKPAKKLTDQARRALIRESTKRPKITLNELQSSTVEIGVSVQILRWREGDRWIFRPWVKWDLDCVCVPFRGWMGRPKDLRVNERVKKNCQNCNVAGFFSLNSFPCVPKGNPVIGVNIGQQPCVTLSTPCRGWGLSTVNAIALKGFFNICKDAVPFSNLTRWSGQCIFIS